VPTSQRIQSSNPITDSLPIIGSVWSNERYVLNRVPKKYLNQVLMAGTASPHFGRLSCYVILLYVTSIPNWCSFSRSHLAGLILSSISMQNNTSVVFWVISIAISNQIHVLFPMNAFSVAHNASNTWSWTWIAVKNSCGGYPTFVIRYRTDDL